MIDYANGGDIRGMVRANEAFLKLANAETRIDPCLDRSPPNFEFMPGPEQTRGKKAGANA